MFMISDILSLVFIFIFALYILFNKNTNHQNSDFVKTVKFFYSDYCVHCKNMKPEWEQFSYKTRNNHQAIDIRSSVGQDEMKKYNITAIPAVIIEFNDNSFQSYSNLREHTLILKTIKELNKKTI